MWRHNQRGIALIQILLLTGVISVLVLYLTQTARQQIRVASLLNDKVQAHIKTYSALNQFSFEFLTTDRIKLIQQKHPHWNYHGLPFAFDQNTQFTVQDQSGLISARFPDKKLLTELLQSIGATGTEANFYYAALLDWQDNDQQARALNSEQLNRNMQRNGEIPDETDIYHIPLLKKSLSKQVLPFVSIYRPSNFNPLQMPEALLRKILSSTIAEQIIELRSKHQLTPLLFNRLTGWQNNDNIIYYPSNIQAIFIKTSLQNVVSASHFVLEFRPYAKGDEAPINILRKY